MHQAYGDVSSKARELDLGLRPAAYCIALERIADALSTRTTKEIVYA